MSYGSLSARQNVICKDYVFAPQGDRDRASLWHYVIAPLNCSTNQSKWDALIK
ncbi:hypothetical protein H1P_6630007 [Hyella patelloides LEGE 07179]|uniref:Uncharacterized protein n=1 Tax=Hyella patelloides LEGE 07179 TaxID=945734 RepID=A0A563W2S2_9CYAN|nr:hypothetical protein H1P_6630007 [Hyella patelloides LEGE 07179]